MSKDVKFDEEQEWNWNSEDQPQKLIVDEEQIQKDEGEIMLAPSLSSNSHAGPISITTRTTKSIQEIYDVTEIINFNDVNIFWLFSGNDPITFEEAYQKDKWKKAMKEEINSIIKNNTWELTTLFEGHNTINRSKMDFQDKEEWRRRNWKKIKPN